MEIKSLKFFFILLFLCFNFVFCFNINNYINNTLARKTRMAADCPPASQDCCTLTKTFLDEFIVAHMTEFGRCCVENGGKEGIVSGFMKESQDYAARTEEHKKERDAVKCAILQCFFQDMKLIDENQLLNVDASDEFVQSSFQNEVKNILIKTNARSVKYANKQGEAFKKLPENTGCNPVGIEYYLIMDYSISAYCPENKRVRGRSCKTYLEKVKKCYEEEL